MGEISGITFSVDPQQILRRKITPQDTRSNLLRLLSSNRISPYLLVHFNLPCRFRSPWPTEFW